MSGGLRAALLCALLGGCVGGGGDGSDGAGGDGDGDVSGPGGSGGQQGGGGHAGDGDGDGDVSGDGDGAGGIPGSGGGGGAACVEPGEDCAAAECCGGSTCVTDGQFFVCAADCSQDAECLSECCYPLDTGATVCSPPVLCAPPGSGGPCSDLVLVADDGTFLGDATSNTFASDGVCNEFSDYGSQFGSNSIYNEFGDYGSPFGSLSAYNDLTQTPPFLYCPSTDTIYNPVSKNALIQGAIDPDALCATLAELGY